MAEKTKKVKVKLHAACYVGGKLRAAGETVEIRKEIAKDFGTLVKAEKPEETPKEK